jgi:hypothetical protein
MEGSILGVKERLKGEAREDGGWRKEEGGLKDDHAASRSSILHTPLLFSGTRYNPR